MTASNVALTTKSLVHGAAQAVAEARRIDLSTFFDLCSLIEACVILDRVETLRSTDPLGDSLLVSRLTEEGVLGQLEPTLSRQEMRRAFLRMPEELTDRMIPVEDEAEPPRADVITPSGALRNVDYSTNLGRLLSQVDAIANYPSVAGVTARTRVHRSNGYLFTAAVQGMDYFPDFDRAPFVAAQLRKLYRSLPVELYRRVAESLDEPLGKAELVSEWTVEASVDIPPLSAVVLAGASSVHDIPNSILKVRDEFARYRHTFARFKTDLRTADTVKRRARLVRHYQHLLKAASGPRPEVITVAEGLNFAQEAARTAAAPAIPTSYSSSLITQPVDWIRRWWMNRPLSILFRIDGKLPRISEYESLITKLWGPAAGGLLTEQYAVHAMQVRRLMTEKVRP